MPSSKMLIDAAHPEETRVVVVTDNRLADFDVEVASRKQLKGNIYLAKVARVEPSLQAAFVEYGGNRHGFLAFNEIHPDYYQIPVGDRQALIAEHEAAEQAAKPAEVHEAVEGATPPAAEAPSEDDADDGETRRRFSSSRSYRIQEVIKPRQILLIQVVKEERGNKGAALTTYLSLAGRYCVLMPNTPRGGGVSRKITNGDDRKRLKSILESLEIPTGMGVIVRTAGSERTKAEIRRDYAYLLKLWDSVRETTLKSTAPTLVHEEADLIKRTIRDTYSRDIEEVLIEGDVAFETARSMMRLLMPSHSKRVKLWDRKDEPLFQHFRIEDQLEATHRHAVQLRSGGYINITPTEALVAVDVNSGRSTRERNIEETATRTNIEAAQEVARQLRLRDLGGLIVIDFIDMDNPRNQAQVERALRDAMRIDRARIQIGRISNFGLLELSRQRLRPSVFETTFQSCAFCGGTGLRRSTDSAALVVLRSIEEEGPARRDSEVTVYVPTAIALYILNNKRPALDRITTRFGLTVRFTSDDSLIPPNFRLDPPRAQSQPVHEPRGEPPPLRPQPESQPGAQPQAGREGGAPQEPGGRRRRRRRGRRHGNGGDQPNLPGATPGSPSTGDMAADSQPAMEHGSAETSADAGTHTSHGSTPDHHAAEPQQDSAGSNEGRTDGQPHQPGQPGQPGEGRRRRRRRGRRGGRGRRGPDGAPLQGQNPQGGEPGHQQDGGEGHDDHDGHDHASEQPAPAGDDRPSIERESHAAPTRHEAPAPRKYDAPRPEPRRSEPEPRAADNGGSEPAVPEADTRKTKTIIVGEESTAQQPAGNRKGWWRRLTS